MCQNVTSDLECFGIYHDEATETTINPYVCKDCSFPHKRLCHRCYDYASANSAADSDNEGDVEKPALKSSNNIRTQTEQDVNSEPALKNSNSAADVEKPALKSSNNMTQTQEDVNSELTSTPRRSTRNRQQQNETLPVKQQRYLNKAFVSGGACDPDSIPHRTQKVSQTIDLKDNQVQESIKMPNSIVGETVSQANKGRNGSTPLIGIVNECDSNTCWFNSIFQSLVWLDPVADSVLEHLHTEKVSV